MGATNPFQDPAPAPAPAGPSHSVPQIDPEPELEPPPAYTPSASQTQSTTLDVGPQRMDFSGPPPVPERFQAPQMTGGGSGQLVNGVGYGYGPRQGHGHGVGSPQQTGSSPMHPHYRPPPPPPSEPADNRPSAAPTPGKPLLREGMLLVYPREFFCKKCHNTGYKDGDPSHPCKNDWKKYGKPYTGPLMISYASATSKGGNATTTASENFQRPLPLHIQHQPPRPPQGVMNHPGLIQNGSHGGGGGYQPPPQQGYGYQPPPQQGHGYQPPPQQGYGYQPPPQQGYGYRPPPVVHHGYGPPAGAVVLRAGDPRLGGQLCYKCGGDGWIDTFLGFDTEQCYKCRGVGRIF